MFDTGFELLEQGKIEVEPPPLGYYAINTYGINIREPGVGPNTEPLVWVAGDIIGNNGEYLASLFTYRDGQLIFEHAVRPMSGQQGQFVYDFDMTKIVNTTQVVEITERVLRDKLGGLFDRLLK